MYVVWDHVGWKRQNKTLTINAQRLPLSCHTESLWAFFIDNDAEGNRRVFYDAIKFASCRRNSMNSSMGNGSLDSCEFPSQNVAPSLKPHLHMEAKNVEFEWKSFSVDKVRTRVQTRADWRNRRWRRWSSIRKEIVFLVSQGGSRRLPLPPLPW